MLACDKVITVIRYADAVYNCTVIDGVSWYEKLQITVQDKGMASANIVKIRIPENCLPNGFLPQPGDVVVYGTISGKLDGPADFGAYRHFTVLGVGDNRRRDSLISHVAVTGA